MDQRKEVSAILALDEKLLKTFLPEDEHEKVTSSFSYPNCQLNNPHFAALVAKEDIEYVLARGYATFEEIRNWLVGCEEAFTFRSFVDLNEVRISSEIRKDWASALRKTRYGL